MYSGNYEDSCHISPNQFYDQLCNDDNDAPQTLWGSSYFTDSGNQIPGSPSPMRNPVDVDVYSSSNQQGQTPDVTSKQQLKLAMSHPPLPSDPLRLNQIQSLINHGDGFSEGSSLAIFANELDPDHLFDPSFIAWVQAKLEPSHTAPDVDFSEGSSVKKPNDQADVGNIPGTAPLELNASVVAKAGAEIKALYKQPMTPMEFIAGCRAVSTLFKGQRELSTQDKSFRPNYNLFAGFYKANKSTAQSQKLKATEIDKSVQGFSGGQR
ncbi:hypothetical protein BJ085DRAFT_40499 [Dimargaris cristalligena]|uniref:Uncharacterized protein n=1 Tax=Dimargaris cristalligena TaxID=215637 RepID=A0A4P9ZM41_9FUNG|nr:hypothetical protein BJ085DRAFT_40499 [Dimargaris cristalligena]|eukprot:RKP33300.1 hypothetical protein BJ085DRAFT_40499 [Dimargaris cristalligena]